MNAIDKIIGFQVGDIVRRSTPTQCRVGEIVEIRDSCFVVNVGSVDNRTSFVWFKDEIELVEEEYGTQRERGDGEPSGSANSGG